jgi:hypothetical protein
MTFIKRDISIGARYGKLVIASTMFDGKRTKIICNCDCGKQTIVATYSIGETTNSCGCLRAETAKKTKTKHGRCRQLAYRSWEAMKRRCLNESDIQYHLYGGRGITVCQRWLSFENFYADMGDREKNYTLERIDVNGNYEPSNCKWATNAEQALNKRNTLKIEYGGIVKPLQLWAKEYGIKPNVLRQRLVRDGLSVHRALHKKVVKGAT